MESEGFTWKQWIFIWAIPVLFFVAVAGFKSVKLPVAPVANAVVEKVPQRSMFAEGVTGSMAYLPIRHKLSGAGDSVVNQTFEKDNSTPGLIQFAGADNADCKIELTVDSEWVISYLGTDLYMVPASSAEEIPASGWVVLPGGASPAPTVEVVIDYTASGAGSVNCNGSYYEIENEWGAGRLFVNENDYAIHIPDAGSYTFMGYPPDLIVENPDEANYRVNSLDPASSGWELTDGINPGLAPAPTVTAVSAPITDATAPTFDSASINADGDQLTVNWTETESAPVTGNTGLSLGGLTHGAATLSNVTTTGTTTTADISRTITVDETPTLSYAPGNFADSADTPNAVASFSGESVTNGSTQPWDAVSPAVASGAVSSNGNTITLTFTEAKSPPILPATGITGFSFRKGSGESLVTGNGTRATPLTVTFNVTGDIYSTDSIYCDYEDGNVTDSASPANNLANFSDLLLTNNASEGDPSMVTREFNVVTASGVTDSYDAGASTDKGYCCHLHVIGVNGTTPTLDVTIEHSDDDTNYEDLVTFDQVTTNGAWRSVSTSDTAEIKRYRRVNYTIGGTDPEIVMLVTAGTKK